jgi:hypothetical protein
MESVMRQQHGHIEKKGKLVLRKSISALKQHKVYWSSSARTKFTSRGGLMVYRVFFDKSAVLKKLTTP